MKLSDKQMFTALKHTLLKGKFEMRGEDAVVFASLFTWVNELEVRVCPIIVAPPVKETKAKK